MRHSLLRRCISCALLGGALTLVATAADSIEPAQTPAAVEPVVGQGVAAPKSAAPAVAAATASKTQLSYTDAAILGLVEGITEFLPVSSTGHLIIANHALGLESDTPLTDAKGQPRWYKKPSEKNPAGIPLTPKLAADTFTVVIQVGAIAAVVLLYAQQLLSIFSGLLGKNTAGLRLLRNIALAFFPCAITGFLLHDWIDAHLFSIPAVITALVSGALLMFWAERWRRAQPGTSAPDRTPDELTATQALGIGLMQCLALWPGTSRSMVVMVGGYFNGLRPARAAEFSFLVGLPTLAGAAVYKGYKSGPAMIEVFGWEPVLVGTAVAAISAGLAVKFLVHYLSRHGLGLFAIYRLVLALVLTWVFVV